MTIEIGPARIAIILLFALTFAMIGWLSPVLYATYVPQDQIITVHEFTAEDTTTASDYHYICFDRTVKSGAAADLFTELYLVNENGERIEMESETIRRYFQSGRDTVVTPFDLPEETLVEGEYRYLLVVQMDLADGRVTRDFTYTSDKFNITDGSPQALVKEDVC